MKYIITQRQDVELVVVEQFNSHWLVIFVVFDELKRELSSIIYILSKNIMSYRIDEPDTSGWRDPFSLEISTFNLWTCP